MPSQTIAFPRSSSQWYEAAMSGPHVAAPMFSTVAVRTVSAPARGGSSDHERQRATRGPGTAPVYSGPVQVPVTVTVTVTGTSR